MATQPQGQGKPIKVDIVACIDAKTNKVGFDHEWEVQGNPTKHKGRIDVPQGEANVPISFHLKDDTGLHLEFYEDPEQAMYVGPPPECPNAPGNGGQIDFPEKASPKLLKVVDCNSGPACDLKYTLRFNGRPNPEGGESAPYEYDPDLRNGGGGITTDTYSYISSPTILIAVVAIAAIVAFVWLRP